MRNGPRERETSAEEDTAPPSALERIVSGAERAFREHGFSTSRVEDILAAGDVSRRTFYQRFAGKDEVAGVLLGRAVEGLVATVKRETERLRSPRSKVAAALDAYLGLFRENGYVKELILESMRPGSKLVSTRRVALDAVIAFIVREAEAGGARSVDPLVVEHLLLGIEGLVLGRLGPHGLARADAERIRDSVLPLFESVLVAVRRERSK